MGDAKRRKIEIDKLKAQGIPKISRDTIEIVPRWTHQMLVREKNDFESMSIEDQNRVISATKKLGKFLGTRSNTFVWSNLFGTRDDTEIGIHFPEENLVYNTSGNVLADIYDGQFVEYDSNRYFFCPGVIAAIDYKRSGKPNQAEWLKDLMTADITDIRVLVPTGV